jgi:hypothetical protein
LSQRAEFRTKATHPYILSGWHTHSEIPLTSVPRSALDGKRVDVVIQMARGVSPILETSKQFLFEHSVELSRIRIGTVADFEVRAGKVITIWPAAGAAQKDIEIVLFGLVWATLCHQRGLLPLHASAIVRDEGIIAFAGHSGAGKSTTAALMHSSDHQVFADDILPIAFNENCEPGAWPYLRRLKLRRDSILQQALAPTEVVSERLDEDKYFVQPKYAADNRWCRLERLYLLEIDTNSSSNSIDQIVGAEAVRALIDQTYHRKFIEITRQFDYHLAFCAKLASKIAIYRLRRSSLSGAEQELKSLIRAHFDSKQV